MINFLTNKMLIEPSFFSMLGISLLSSSLVTSSTFNIDKTYHNDKKAYDYGLIASILGFSGLLVTIFVLLYVKLYSKGHKFVTYSFLFLLLNIIILIPLIYLTYDHLDKSYHHPTGGVKHVSNKIERRLIFASFCFVLIGDTIGLSYILTHGIESDFFDKITGGKLNIKKMFTFFEKKSDPPRKTFELDNLLDDLTL